MCVYLLVNSKKRSIAFLRFIYRINNAQTINRLFKANRLSLEFRESIRSKRLSSILPLGIRI